MAGCPSFDPLAPYMPGVVEFVDCHARALGEDGYRALGAGSPIGTVIGGLVTVYIALLGYRMLLGDTPTIRDAVLAAVRIGMVVALATQWPAYQVLVYDVVVDEPAALSARIFAGDGLGGDDARGLVGRLQGSYDAMQAIAYPDPAAQTARPNPLPNQPDTPGSTAGPQLPTVASGSTLTIAQRNIVGSASTILLIGSLVGLVATRVVAGILLALGPIFVACLLFEALRGLFVGWARALVGTIIGAIGVIALLSLELAILAPQVVALTQAVEAGDYVPVLTGEIYATSVIFALVVAVLLAAAAFTTAGLRLPTTIVREIATMGDRHYTRLVPTLASGASPVMLDASTPPRSRSAMIADAVLSSARRETTLVGVPSTGNRAAIAERHESGRGSNDLPLGQSARRSNRRHSATAARRDKLS